LLVTIDTLRADFTTPYGHPADPTPNLARVAAVGARFARHYTVMSHTAPSHLTLFTGLSPRRHGLRKNGLRVPEGLPLLPEAMRAAGYRTVAVVGVGFLGRATGFDRGFEIMDDDMDAGAGAPPLHERLAEAVVDRTLALLAKADGRPNFVWVHFYDPHDPHDPYEAPERHRVPAARARATYAKRVEAQRYSRRRLIWESAAYEAEVRYVDEQLGRLLEAWDSDPRRREGLVVITSDHGEGLGEHMLLRHGFWSYEEQIHVPLVLRMPAAIPAGTVVPGPTSHVDLARTVADLAGVDAHLGGRSLVSRIGGEAEEIPPVFAERRLFTTEDLERRQELVRLVELLEGRPGAALGDQITMIEGDYKYIWTAYAPDELYHLGDDPEETDVRIEALPERAAEMREKLVRWRSLEAETPGAPVELVDPETRKMLDALGY
jgi:arylsulfatase A-like enzyme